MKRIEYIDILKGIGIILVVLGHVTKNEALSSFIYAFHMPLFFYIAGMFLRDKPGFTKSHARSLLIPYIFFGFISFVYWILIELRFRDLGGGSKISELINLIYPTSMHQCNVVLWFLPCLFIGCIITNFINYLNIA